MLWDDFVELVKVNFAFLSDELGFRVLGTKPPFVTYESTQCGVDIFFDVGGRHELDITVRRLGDDSRLVPLLHLSLMAKLAGAATSDVGVSVFPQSRQDLDNEVPRWAADLRKYGREYLLGDPEAWNRVDEIRRRTSKR